MARHRKISLLLFCALGAGCSDLGDLGVSQSALTAQCSVTVVGRGVKDVESDYLPHVVACENGMADTEALKAQAVAARSYMYYRIGVSGTIEDGVSDQVYTCANKPLAKHYAAVDATSGQVIQYGGEVICAFFVAGAQPSSSSCVALGSDQDSTPPTEWAVTYNESKVGSQVTQSPIGSIDPTVIANRGCLSQNGSHCLSLKGMTYPQILNFYYGADIQLVTASGACVVPPPTPDAAVPEKDTGPPEPKEDAFIVKTDTGATDLRQASDGGPGLDTVIPLPIKVEEGVTPPDPEEKGQDPSRLRGSCSAGGGRPGPGSLLVVLLLLLRLRRSQIRISTRS